MEEKIEAQLSVLRAERAKCQEQLEQLAASTNAVTRAMLNIEGAILVCEVLLAEEEPVQD